jgi:hypothetical protein
MGLLKVAAIFLLMGMLVAPLAGFVKVTVGATAVTVKVCGPLVPIEFVTVTLWAPAGAFRVMVNVAVIDVLLTTVVLLTVMPVPLTLIADPAPKFVPVSVTATAAPWTPLLGPIEVKTGLGVPEHPAMKTTSRSVMPRPRDRILPAPYFQSGDSFILTDIAFLHFLVDKA